MKTEHHDLYVHYGGSICTVLGVTAEAQAWLEQHTPDGAMWWGRALVVEPRYVDNVINARDDALRSTA